MVDKSVVELIHKYLFKLKLNGLNVSRAILYGSQVRGDFHEDSDIDLILISPEFENLCWSQEGLAWEVAQFLDWRIEPVLFGEHYFEEHDWHPLIDTVKREGIEICSEKPASVLPTPAGAGTVR